MCQKIEVFQFFIKKKKERKREGEKVIYFLRQSGESAINIGLLHLEAVKGILIVDFQDKLMGGKDTSVDQTLQF